MLCNGYNSKLFYKEFHWIYLVYEETDNYCWLLLITGLYLKSKSFTTYCVTLYKHVKFWGEKIKVME